MSIEELIKKLKNRINCDDIKFDFVYNQFYICKGNKIVFDYINNELEIKDVLNTIITKSDYSFTMTEYMVNKLINEIELREKKLERICK